VNLAAEAGPARAPAFSPKTILALVIVGLVSFSGLAVLSAYAPELRGGADGQGHALSSSAVGFKGAVVMLKAEDAPTVISRAVPKAQADAIPLLVLTPGLRNSAKDLAPFETQENVLIVLPKWAVSPHPTRLGFVDKAGIAETGGSAAALLKAYATKTEISHRKGVSRPVLRAGGTIFSGGTYLPLGDIDGLQTISGEGWQPALVDDQGRTVLARSKSHTGVLVLADPDLLNTQGLAKLDNARAGMAIVNTLRGGEGVLFDVTLNGFRRGRGIGRLMLEPPWLSATLCGVAAALLLGLHGLARFGPTRTTGRAIALGKRPLVDNSAGLVRMARKEHELAPAYAALTLSLATRAGGGDRTASAEDNERWLTELSRRHGAASPADLRAEADRARTRDDLLNIGRKLYDWKLEITRERR
jgi:hypothetical protein